MSAPTPEMILIVAQAMGPKPWAALPVQIREAFVDKAILAITAMRNHATPKMWEKAKPHMDSYSSNAAWWTAMHDAALTEL